MVRKNQVKIGKKDFSVIYLKKQSMKIAVILFSLIISSVVLQAQENNQYLQTFVAKDTLLDGNSFEFRILIKNMQGDFTPPTFSDFDIIRGPNISKSMKIVNGEMSKESSYTYVLRPRKLGENYIDESYFSATDVTLETTPIEIIVINNPEEIENFHTLRYNAEAQIYSPFKIQAPADTKTKKPKRPMKKI